MTVLIRIIASIIFIIALGGCTNTGNHVQADDQTRLAAFAGADVISFKVHGMACRNCANEIAHELEEVDGVLAAIIDFDSATAKVARDPDPAKMPSKQVLQAAVEHWRSEHFAAKEDPNCLDPKKREELQRGNK